MTIVFFSEQLTPETSMNFPKFPNYVHLLGTLMIIYQYLDKLYCGLEQSPAVKVGEKQQKQKLGRKRGIPNPSWSLVRDQHVIRSLHF